LVRFHRCWSSTGRDDLGTDPPRFCDGTS
jgi:hypothetical protein